MNTFRPDELVHGAEFLSALVYCEEKLESGIVQEGLTYGVDIVCSLRVVFADD